MIKSDSFIKGFLVALAPFIEYGGFTLIRILRLLSPFIVIRIAVFNGDRIGHLCTDLLNYSKLYKREDAKVCINLLIYRSSPANRFLLRKWQRVDILPRYTFVMQSRYSFVLEAIRYVVDNAYKDKIKNPIKINFSHEEVLDRLLTTKAMRLTSKEKQRGRFLAKSLGIPYGSKWVCIHNRDSSYLSMKYGQGVDCSHHDYRDFSPEVFRETIEFLITHGIYVIRMGKTSNAKIDSIDSDLYIDYTDYGFQDDLLDIYLLAECHFYLGSSSGICCVPMLFGRWTGMINYPSTQMRELATWKNWPDNCIVLPSKLTDKTENNSSYSGLHRLINERTCSLYSTQDLERNSLVIGSVNGKEVLEMCKDMVNLIGNSPNTVLNSSREFWGYYIRKVRIRDDVNVDSPLLASSFIKSFWSDKP